MRDDWTTYRFVIYDSWVAFDVTTLLASGPHPARFSAFDFTAPLMISTNIQPNEIWGLTRRSAGDGHLFLKYQPSPLPPMLLSGAAIARVSSFKLLGVTLSNDLSWNDHCHEMLKKACKHLYALRSLKAAGLDQKDLVLVYCSLVRSALE